MGSTNSSILRNQTTSGQASGRPNYTPTITLADGSYPGHIAWSRTGASVWEAYAQGVDAGGGTQASAALTNADIRIGSQGTAFGVNQIAGAHLGSGLTAGEVAALYSALNTYLQAVGAA